MELCFQNKCNGRRLDGIRRSKQTTCSRADSLTDRWLGIRVLVPFPRGRESMNLLQ